VNRLTSLQTRRELTSPAVVVGILAIAVEMLLFVLDRTLPEDQPGGAMRHLMSWVASAAPWLIPIIVLVATTAWLLTALRRVSAELRAANAQAEAWRQKSAEFEGTIRELRTPKEEPAPKRPKYAWLRGWEDGHGELLIQNSELEQFYERAVQSLNDQRLEAGLSGFAVFADPFLPTGWARVRVSLDFWAPAATREYSFSFDEFDSMLQVGPGAVPRRPVQQFINPPWRSQPQWCEIVRICAIRAGKLVPDSNAGAFVAAYEFGAGTEWRVTINDFGAGETHVFAATSPQDVRPND